MCFLRADRRDWFYPLETLKFFQQHRVRTDELGYCKKALVTLRASVCITAPVSRLSQGLLLCWSVLLLDTLYEVQMLPLSSTRGALKSDVVKERTAGNGPMLSVIIASNSYGISA